MMQLNKNIMLFIFMILPMCNVVASDSPENKFEQNIVKAQQQAEIATKKAQEVAKKVGADSKNMFNCYYNTFCFMKSPQETEFHGVLLLKDIVRDEKFKKALLDKNLKLSTDENEEYKKSQPSKKFKKEVAASRSFLYQVGFFYCVSSMTLLAAIPFVERKDALTLFKGSAACFALGLCSHYKSQYDIKAAGNRACKDLKSIEKMIEEIENNRKTKE